MSSYLFVPGNNPGMIQSSSVFGAKAIIFDLEDAVSDLEKDRASGLLFEFLSSDCPKNAYIRINDVYQLGKNEIKRFDKLGVIGYVVPKASVEVLNEVKKHTKKNLIPIIETPEGVLNMREVGEVENVVGMLLGGEDLATSISVIRTEDDLELMYAKHKMVLITASLEIDSIDTPYTDTDAEESLEEAVRKSKALGMKSRSCIHPNQIAIINDVYKPTLKEIEFAKRIVKEAKINKLGAFSVDGKMVDKPVIISAENILEKAKEYGLL